MRREAPVAGLALAIWSALGTAAVADVAPPVPPVPPAPAVQPATAEAGGARDGYSLTRYELLVPGSAKFRIAYDVSATRPGAKAYYNPIRKGSVTSEERVTDLATGKVLKFKIVSGAAAKGPEFPDADPGLDYIRVALARPVPGNGGEGRIRIEKTYEDAKSYYMDGADLVFERSLGVKRNAVVLPAGYRLIACNYPSQVMQEADGRIRISFFNVTPAEAPLKLRARLAGAVSSAPSSVQDRLSDRSTQSRTIVYFLREPEAHTFDLYHDYTEDRPGTDKYVNVVRPGSTVANPSARNLDTGEAIPAQILRGQAITKAGIKDPALTEIKPETEIVVFRFKTDQAAAPCAFGFPRPTPTPNATSSWATSSCSTVRSADPRIRWCCRQAGR
ncbi:MAG: hypothetical protein U1E87_00910 [Alphaproteobacteria bacterium]